MSSRVRALCALIISLPLAGCELAAAGGVAAVGAGANLVSGLIMGTSLLVESPSQARPVSMSRPVPSDPGRSCASFRRGLELQVIENANRPQGVPVRPFLISRSDMDRCNIDPFEADLRRRYPRAFETGGRF